MGRIPLKKKSILNLQHGDGHKEDYKIKSLLSAESLGASCICYRAVRISDGKTIVLKEFYPNNSELIERTDNGRLNIAEFLYDLDEKYDYLRKSFESFKKSALYLDKYSKNESTKDNICSSDNTDILEGNGTYYYENEYYKKSKSWYDCAGEKNAKGDELIQVALGSYRFLNKLHSLEGAEGNGDALVDFKSQDVLVVPRVEDGNVGTGLWAYNTPLFFDFGSVLTLNKKYSKSLIEGTPEYMPDEFSKAYDTDDSGEEVVSIRTENYTFARVFETLLLRDDSDRYFTPDIQKRLSALMNKLKNCSRDDKEIEVALMDIRDEIQENEKSRNEDDFDGKQKKFNLIRVVLFAIAIIMHIVLAGVMIYLCVNSQAAQKYITENDISVSLLAILLCILTFALAALKLFVSLMSQKLTNLEVSLEYFDRKKDGKSIKTAEYNTFQKGGGRKQTTYQDKSLLNIRRQRLRLFLWIVLFICIVSGLVISISVNACPLFFIIGFISIIIFMYADALPSTVDFFNSCMGKTSLKLDSLKEKRAWYFSDEYYESKDTEHFDAFDVKSDFYVKNNRNIYMIRKQLIDEVYDIPREMSLKTRMTNLLSYKKRNDFYDSRKKDVDYNLRFTPLIIRNTYKMLFDRMKNKYLIINFSVLVVTLFTIFLDFVFFTGAFKDYFMMPDIAYPFVIISLLVVTTGVSIWQILYSYEEEKLIADASYKSRFVLDFALNGFLVEDISKGYIQPVDIVRGINQAEANIFTLGDKKKGKKAAIGKKRDVINTRLLHHDIEAYRRRLAITVWLLFGTVMSFIVWYLGIYILLIPLILAFAFSNIIFSKIIIPKRLRKNTIRDIEKLEKKMR